MKRDVKMATRAILQSVQQQYHALLMQGNTIFSLEQLFDSDQFAIREFCRSFRPHAHAPALAQAARAFGEQHGIWLETAEHYITCAIFLFTSADTARMMAIVENLAVDYYLNDTMGREVFGRLSSGQQRHASMIIDRMGNIDVVQDDITAPHPVEIANRQVLQFMKETSPEAWFDQFLELYCYHVKVTHRNCNATEMGRIPSVAEYVDSRCHMAGMHHVISLLEYSDGAFLDHAWLEAMGIMQPLKRLQYVTAAIGGLMNDLFSFEKEVIDNGADANLVMVLALNHPALTLEEVLLKACQQVNGLLVEFQCLYNEVMSTCQAAVAEHVIPAASLHKHLEGLERCVQASWVWQVHTARYKRAHSIWEETQLQDVMARAV
ncbi:terpene synthase family protein [Chitinophaga vietnamensis]|uniref:terpene synthase family protein n=1 Tax=Chitinophaga vietnamensis TaxID=2593957 RepID=UPI00117869C0|nr:hypothetical protein [Chitinophaga vietnamensis]